MEQIVLKANKRDVCGKQVKVYRREGQLPAVVYGRGIDPIPVVLDYREAIHILPTLTSSQLVVVEVDGNQYMSLVREKQRHPVSGALLHVDFQRVSMTERLRAKVMLELIGEAPAVKNYSGILVTVQEEVEVECLPRDLPEKITVSLAELVNIGDSIHVRDLVLPPKVDVLSDPGDMIVVVTAPEAEEVVVEEAVGAEEPEVIERGKKEEENY
jgi:large subunit ribosomal protein L25